MKTQNTPLKNHKQKYNAPKVEKIQLDNEISMVMMSVWPNQPEFPEQDPLMSLKGFKLFK